MQICLLMLQKQPLDRLAAVISAARFTGRCPITLKTVKKMLANQARGRLTYA
jgi:hypothetical protein